MRTLRSEAALYVIRRQEAPPVRIEARPAGHQRVLFVHGARSHMLAAISEHATIELHLLHGVHIVLCIDRGSGPRAGTVKIRNWTSRDAGASWTIDSSLDVTSLGPATCLMREGPSR